MESENFEDSDYEEVIDECEYDFEDEFDQIIPLKDDAKFVLKGHSNVVLCVTCDSKNSVLFTGGMDDNVIAWNMENGQQICVLYGHSDSVTHLSLDNTDTFLVTGDLQGLVIVWKVTLTPLNITKFKTIELSEVVNIQWRLLPEYDEEHLFLCDKVGTVQSFTKQSISDESTMEMIPLFYSQGKGCSCNGFNIILSEKYSAVLYGGSCDTHENCSNTNELNICDINTYKLTKVDLKAVANEEEEEDEGMGAGFATHRLNNSEMIAIGDWSQMILASVIESAGNVSCKLTKVPIKDGGLVTNIAFSDVVPFLAFASKHGVIGVYDLSHNRIRHQWNYTATIATELHDDQVSEQLSVSVLKWKPGQPQFLTCGLDGRICMWDARVNPNGEVPCWWGHSGIVWDMLIVSGANKIVTVSEDQTARLFEI